MDPQFVALLSFVNGLFVAWTCICRLASTHINVIPSVRFKYVMLMVGSLAFGSQPFLFNESPTTGGLILHFAITAALIANYGRWRGGPPNDTLKRFLPEI